MKTHQMDPILLGGKERGRRPSLASLVFVPLVTAPGFPCPLPLITSLAPNPNSKIAPAIVVAILNGRQTAVLTATKLMADTRLPLAWIEQRKALGFA